MQQSPYLNRRRILLVGMIVAVVIVAIFFVMQAPHPINPNTDKKLVPDAGVSYAQIYKFGPLYSFIGQNDGILRNIEDDVLLFARSTRPEFKDAKSKVALTIDGKGKKNTDGSTTFTGYFYGVKDQIKLQVTRRTASVYKLSITNQHDKTNIDGYLSMNGPRNDFLASLPQNKSGYSIRYQLTDDRIVVTFYRYYTSADVDAATATIRTAFGDQEPENVIYSINGIGIMSVAAVRQNLITPAQQ